MYVSIHYSGTSTLLYNYRNKASISDYTAGGALAGAIYKFSLGPKGMISGGVFGGLFGTFAGAMMIGMLKLTGTTMPQLYSQTQIPFRQVDQQFHASFKVSFSQHFHDVRGTSMI